MEIGNLKIKQALFLAPMEAVTDTAFRLICKKQGADVVVTEFTSSEAMVRDIPVALKKIDITDEERPVGIQIFGFSPESMKVAAEVAEKLGPDFIDINAGCWVKKHVGRGEGAGLLRDLPRFEAIVKATVKATKLPVTVKTRLGWDMNSIVIMDVAKMVQDCGAKALTLHCRTRSQGYQGQADWSYLEKVRQVISIPLIGNGDVVCPEDAKTLFDMGCDGVMIGRGAIANPYIFKQIKHFLATGESLSELNLKEKINLCIEHLNLSVQLRGELEAILPFRKHYSGYLKGVPYIAKLRADLMQLTSQADVINRLNQFMDENEF